MCDKLKSYNLNPYIINWIISFLCDREQRVVIDRVTTKFVDINRGVPQVLGPVLFSVIFPVGSSVVDQSQTEVNNIQCWATEN